MRRFGRCGFIHAIASVACWSIVAPAATAGPELTPDEVIAALRKPSSSTGNIADAVEEATGARGFMSHDMKPIFRARIVGRAATALLRPVLKHDQRAYPNHALQILDEAAPGSVLVYVLENGLDIAGMGNLMATTAKVRGLERAVIDGAARDIEEVTRIGFPIFSRAVSPATSVGRYVSVAKQVPVTCAGIRVKPGDTSSATRMAWWWCRRRRPAAWST
jgi:regulator of RNase E activity RraA